jgi:hypothetical protein
MRDILDHSHTQGLASIYCSQTKTCMIDPAAVVELTRSLSASIDHLFSFKLEMPAAVLLQVSAFLDRTRTGRCH